MNPLKKGEEEDLEAEGREVVRNLEKKSKKQKEKQLSDVKADYIMKSLKRKANEKYEIEDLVMCSIICWFGLKIYSTTLCF